MNKIEELLWEEHSAYMAEYIADCVIKGQWSMDQLMDCFFSDDWRLCQRASWAVTKLCDRRPDFLIPYVGLMADNLERPVHDAVVRNTVRIWQNVPIPEEHLGKVYERCFDMLNDRQRPTAIRVFSITVCANIAEKHPTLTNELVEVIRDNLEYGTAGFQSRAKKVLRRMARLNKSLE